MEPGAMVDDAEEEEGDDAALPDASALEGFHLTGEADAARALDIAPVLEALASKAVTRRAREDLLRLSPVTSVEAASRLYSGVREVEELPDELPLTPDVDFSRVLERAARVPTLSVEELVRVERGVSALAELRRFLFVTMEEKAFCPLLQEIGKPIVVDEEVTEGLRGAFDEEGELSGSKFPEVGRLRREVKSISKTVEQRLKSLMSDEAFTSQLSDSTVNRINGRYVVAVPPSQKRRVGIVHDVSRSGKTVFVEPEQLIAPTNQLAEAKATLRAEESRILSQLTLLVAKHSADLSAGVAAAAELDALRARHLLGAAWVGEVPEVASDGVLDAKDARHPVLCLKALEDRTGKSTCIGNSLSFDGSGRAGSQALLISGPNAGGKTIVLKTMGLLAFLARLGVPVPAGRDARVDLFYPIVAVIGDDQSVAGGVSTFQAHCLALNGMLRAAKPGALLLCDEIGSGTDPAQGSALAQSVIEHCIGEGSLVGVTTHYSRLKDYAAQDERFALGAMILDDNGGPTYRLRVPGVGESYGIEMAQRCFDASFDPLLGRARELLGSRERQLSELLLEAERQRAEAERATAEAEAAKAKAKSLETEAEKTVQAAEEKFRGAMREGMLEWSKEMKRRERQLEDLERQLKADPNLNIVGDSLREMRAVRRTVDEESFALEAKPDYLPLAEDKAVEEGAELVVIEAGPWAGHVGKVVKVRRRKRKGLFVEKYEMEFGRGILAEFPREAVGLPTKETKRGKAKGGGGAPRGRLSKTLQQDLEIDKVRSKKGAQKGAAKGAAGRATAQIRLDANTCDVRGKQLHEAKTEIDFFLDRCIGNGFTVAYVLHGHGTGALKKGLRTWLPKASPFVKSSKPAKQEDGGDAFTEVQLK